MLGVAVLCLLRPKVEDTPALDIKVSSDQTGFADISWYLSHTGSSKGTPPALGISGQLDGACSKS